MDTSLPPPPPPSSSSPISSSSPLMSSSLSSPILTNNQKKRRKDKKSKDKDKQGDGKIKKDKEERKLYTKLIIKRLPAMNYDIDRFEESLDGVCSSLDINRDDVCTDHFLKGKLSRKRGPVYGNGFIVIKDNTSLEKFMDINNKNIPFINDDISDQPSIILSPYQKVFKTVKKADDLMDTYETDPEYISFIERLNQPEVKRQPIDNIDQVSKDAPIVDMMKDVPLLAFLKQKAEKEMALKKFRGGQSAGKGGSSFKKQKIKDRKSKGDGKGNKDGTGQSRKEKYKDKKKDKKEANTNSNANSNTNSNSNSKQQGGISKSENSNDKSNDDTNTNTNQKKSNYKGKGKKESGNKSDNTSSTNTGINTNTNTNTNTNDGGESKSGGGRGDRSSRGGRGGRGGRDETSNSKNRPEIKIMKREEPKP